MYDEIEEWKSIDEIYLISSWGRIWNSVSSFYVSWHIHKSRSNLYWRVNLGSRKHMVHVLVATYFVAREREDQTQVEHIDNNTLNPNKNNVKWATPKENISYKYLKAKPPGILLQ